MLVLQQPCFSCSSHIPQYPRQGAASAAEADSIMNRADAELETSMTAYEELRGSLPTVLRRLTAGYELRVWWFEIFVRATGDRTLGLCSLSLCANVSHLTLPARVGVLP